jgi:rhomboid family GlyGly-CTERM serine protease
MNAELRLYRPALDRRESSLWLSILAVAFLSLAAILATESPVLTSMLQLDRSALSLGQWWRLFTGHLTHWNRDHLLWDVAAFFALGTACAARSWRATGICLMSSALAISGTFLLTRADLSCYRGLSGVDSALFGLLAGQLYWQSRRTGDAALGALAKWSFALFAAKVGFEIVTGHTLFVDSEAAGFVPLAAAHAAGLLVGVGTACGAAVLRRVGSPPNLVRAMCRHATLIPAWLRRAARQAS